jgi:hypothetical protein
MANLFDRLLKDVPIINSTEYGGSETLLKEDAPYGKSTIFINPEIYPEGSPARDKIIRSEALHLLKEKEPEMHKDLIETALRDRRYMDSARHSFDVVRGLMPDEEGNYIPREKREKRRFDEWHNISRFDQVIGGYIMAQDKDIPTMKNWDRNKMAMGPELRSKLEGLAREFNREERPRLDMKPKQQR